MTSVARRYDLLLPRVRTTREEIANVQNLDEDEIAAHVEEIGAEYRDAAFGVVRRPIKSAPKPPLKRPARSRGY